MTISPSRSLVSGHTFVFRPMEVVLLHRMVAAEFGGHLISADLHLLLDWQGKELLCLVQRFGCQPHIHALSMVSMPFYQVVVHLTWFVIKKKPMFRDASRISSARACRSLRSGLYIRETSMRGRDSSVVATLDLAVTVEPLTS